MTLGYPLTGNFLFTIIRIAWQNTCKIPLFEIKRGIYSYFCLVFVLYPSTSSGYYNQEFTPCSREFLYIYSGTFIVLSPERPIYFGNTKTGAIICQAKK